VGNPLDLQAEKGTHLQAGEYCKESGGKSVEQQLAIAFIYLSGCVAHKAADMVNCGHTVAGVILGDMNAKVGRDTSSLQGYLGRHGSPYARCLPIGTGNKGGCTV
jgi:hypothetical protein